jgi:hypothetical protein
LPSILTRRAHWALSAKTPSRNRANTQPGATV